MGPTTQIPRTTLESLQPFLNFTAHLQTNLNLLILGDSVAIQMGQLMEEALGATSRQVLHHSWAGNEGVTISASPQGGAMALYRLTGMFLPSGEGKPLPNAAGGGWNRSHVQALMGHPHLKPSKEFDAMIFRIPHGWLNLEEITQESLHQSIQLANQLFGVHQVILVDIPFTNNIQTPRDLQLQNQTNAMIRQLAASYDNDPQLKVTTLQFARWTDQLMLWNARAIGVLPPAEDNKPNSNHSNQSYYALDRLGCPIGAKFPLSIAQGCAEFAKAGDCRCRRNRITHDGMHWCLESIGGRFVAGVACLLSCLQSFEGQRLRQCETRCNDQFMSMRLPDPELFG